TVDRDLQMILSLGHMHEYGKQYRLEVVDEGGKTLRTIHDDTWRPEYTSHPPIKHYSPEEPLKFPKGTRLKQTCRWNNATPDSLLFPREMCIGFFYYFPEDEDLTCDMVTQ